jgi:hypothetical protein
MVSKMTGRRYGMAAASTVLKKETRQYRKAMPPCTFPFTLKFIPAGNIII